VLCAQTIKLSSVSATNNSSRSEMLELFRPCCDRVTSLFSSRVFLILRLRFYDSNYVLVGIFSGFDLNHSIP